MRVAQALGDEHGDRRADHVRRLVGEEPRGRSVHIGDRACGVPDEIASGAVSARARNWESSRLAPGTLGVPAFIAPGYPVSSLGAPMCAGRRRRDVSDRQSSSDGVARSRMPR